ncbi:MAG: aspartate carbamoyltransferase regulatory subunit [Oscillospiraceae bacterium]
MINVSKLKKGIVLDHIKAGQGFKIFTQLGLDKLNDVVVLMKNVDSTKMGKKDLIKIETDDFDLNLDVLGLINPGITVNYISDGKLVQSKHLTLPQKVTGILKCKNPRCISQVENLGEMTFTLVDTEKKEYACEYCDSRTSL